MKRLFLGFILGAALGGWGMWYFLQGRPTTSEASPTSGSSPGKSTTISMEDIKKELERTGLVVRQKASEAGTAIADATANTRTTAAIKAKLLADAGLSAIHINVDTTDGLVTLSGTATSHDQVARAVKIALETEGVRKVVSTMQVTTAR